MAHLAVIGGGNMGRAILVGAVRAGVLAAADVSVGEPREDKRAMLEAEGIAAFATAGEAVTQLDEGGQVLLAVKPQVLAAVAAELAGGDADERIALENRVVISILAGVRSEVVRTALSRDGREGPRVVRVMPNLPAAIGMGATAVSMGAGARPGDEAYAASLFQGVGPVVVTLPEALMDAFTAVAGSGPAYLFLLAEAMIAGARRVGLDEATARSAVIQTLAGSSAMLAADIRDPAELRAAVTSKGGTTEAAMDVLLGEGVIETWAKGIEAARDRGRELGRMAEG